MTDNKTNLATDGAHIDRINNIVSIDFGQYFEYAPANIDSDKQTLLIAGSIYITIDVMENVITGEIQTIRIYQPASETTSTEGKGKTFSIDFEEFTRDFKAVDMATAEKIRSKQLAALQGEAHQLGNDIKAALSDPNELLRQIGISDNAEIAEGREGLHQSLGLPSPEMMASRGTEVISSQDGAVAVIEHKKRFENQAMLGRLAKQLTQQKTGQLSTVLANTTDLLMEASMAIRGKADDMTRKVDDVMKKITVMDFYLGTDIFVKEIRTGEPASSDIKFSLSTAMICMDEEIATELIFCDGSFDFSNKTDFIARLATSDSLLNRIMPNERSIIIIRPTRSGKAYLDYHPMEAANLNAMNKSAFLLVRDGERLHSIHSPLDYNQRLFPTDKEMDSFFEQVWATSVNRVSQQRRFEDMANNYHRMIAMLQGVLDRQAVGEPEVFGELPYESFGNSFTNPAYIVKNCHFINDEDNLLANQDLPKDVHQWIGLFTYNAIHIKNDIVVFKHRLLSQSVIPAAYRRTERSHEAFTDWETDHNNWASLGTDRITMFKGEPVLLVELNHQFNDISRNFRALVNKAEGRIINIMAMPPSVLDKVLQSRELRPTLTRDGYMEMLVKAREVILKVKQETAPIREALEGYYPAYAADQIHLMIMDWVRGVKAGWDGELIAPFNTKAAVTAIVNNHNKSLAFSDSVIKTAVKAIEAEQSQTAVFASKHLGSLHIFTASRAAVGSYRVSMQGVDFPFFNHYKVSTSGQVSHEGIIGSDIQQYPITTVLTDDLSQYKLSNERLSTADWKKLASKTDEHAALFARLLTLMDNAFAGNDEDKLGAIKALAEQIELSNENIRESRNTVNFAMPALPVYIEKEYDYIVVKGLRFNLPMAALSLYRAMSPAGLKGYKLEVNEIVGDEIRMNSFISYFEEQGTTEFIGTYRAVISSILLSRMTDKEEFIRRGESAIGDKDDHKALLLVAKQLASGMGEQVKAGFSLNKGVSL